MLIETASCRAQPPSCYRRSTAQASITSMCLHRGAAAPELSSWQSCNMFIGGKAQPLRSSQPAAAMASPKSPPEPFITKSAAHCSLVISPFTALPHLSPFSHILPPYLCSGSAPSPSPRPLLLQYHQTAWEPHTSLQQSWARPHRACIGPTGQHRGTQPDSIHAPLAIDQPILLPWGRLK